MAGEKDEEEGAHRHARIPSQHAGVAVVVECYLGVWYVHVLHSVVHVSSAEVVDAGDAAYVGEVAVSKKEEGACVVSLLVLAIMPAQTESEAPRAWSLPRPAIPDPCLLSSRHVPSVSPAHREKKKRAWRGQYYCVASLLALVKMPTQQDVGQQCRCPSVAPS